MSLPEGEFLRHAACPSCGSSDGLAVYSSGTSFCYSCKKYFDKVKEKSMDGLLAFGEVKALNARKLTKATCQHYSYNIASYKGKLVQVAPYQRKRVVVAQHIRFPDKSFAWAGKMKGVELFGQHLYPPGGQRLIITEGEIDCLSIAQVFNLKWAVVSIPSGAAQGKQAILDNLEYVNSFDEIVFAFDNDEPGKKAFEECAPLVTPGKAKCLNYSSEFKDANDYLQAGKATELAQAVFKAIPYRPDGVKNGKDLWEDFNAEDEPGYTIPYPILNDLLYGMRKGELVMYTAGSGIGKSTLVHEIAYHLLTEHKLSIGVLALEENKKRLASRYPSINLNKPLHLPGVRSSIPPDILKEAFDATTGSGRFWMYDHWGSKDIDSIVSKIRYMVLGCKCDFIIIDHISIVVSGLDEIAESERKMIDKFMTALTSLIAETGVGIQAVVHLKRPSQGKSFGEGREVVLTDLRGSGALEQMSFTVISLNRNQMSKNPDESWIRVLKSRTIGKLGVADTLIYNHDTGRLLPTDESSLFEVDSSVNTDF